MKATPLLNLSLIAVAASMPFVGNAQTTYTWDGSDSSTWSTGTNWVGDAAPTATGILEFSGTATSNQPTDNDLTALTSFSAINFTNDGTTPTQYTLGGNSITLGGNITSTIIVGGGTTLNDVIDNDIVLVDPAPEDPQSVLANTGHDIEISGDISGAFQLNISDGGTGNIGLTTLSGNNTHARTFVNRNGNLRVSSNTAVGDDLGLGWDGKLHLSDGVILNPTNGIDLANLRGQRIIFLDDAGTNTADIQSELNFQTGTANGRSNAFVIGDDDTLTISGKLTSTSGSTGKRTYKQGAGTLVFTNGTNDYVGTMRADAGTIEIQHPLALGTARVQPFGGSIVFDDATVSNAATFGSLSNSGNLVLETSTGGALALTVGVHPGNDSYAGILSDNGSNGGSLIKIGTFTQTLTGANTYGGTTTITDGTLALGGTLGALTGTTGIINNGNLALARSNTFTQATDLNGQVISGTGTVTQSGTGTSTLSAANTYTGATTVSAGTLEVSGSITSDVTVTAGTLEVTGSSTSAINVNAGGTLSGEGSASGTVTLDSGSTLTVDPNTAGAFDAAGTLAPTATVNVALTAAPTSPGVFTVINYGTYGGVVNTDFALTNPANFRSSTFVDTTSSITLDIQSETHNWTGADGVNPTHLDVATSTNWDSTDNLFYELDTITFGDTGVGAVAVQSVTVANGINFTNTSGNNYTFDDITADAETLSGDITVTGAGDVTLNVKITGNTDITHSGTGTLTLAGDGVANDFVGDILVDGGGILKNDSTLNNSGLGDGANTFTFRNGSTFDLNANLVNQAYKGWAPQSFIFENGTTLTNSSATATNNAFNDELEFAGDVTLAGTGRFDIDSGITVTGTNIVITVNNTGGNVIGGDNSAQSIGEWVINSGARVFAGVDGALGDNSIITINAGGVLRGNTATNTVRTIINDITLNGGQIQSAFANSDTHLTGTVTVPASSSLAPNVDDNDDREIHLTGTLTGAGDLTIESGVTHIASSLDFSGYTGDFILDHNFTRTTILRIANGVDLTQDVIVNDNAGIKALQLENTGSGTGTFSGSVTINDSNSFQVFVPSATDTLTLSGVISGSGSAGLQKTGAGTLVLSNVNTYTGDTTATAGTLSLNGTSLDDSGSLIIDGGNVAVTGVETVDTLFVGAVQQAAGTYTNTEIAAITSGSITVITGPAGFDAWATDSGLDGTAGKEDGEIDDPEFDGIENVLEYILGGDPLASDTSILPTSTRDATNFELTFKRSDASEGDAPASVEFGTDLTFGTATELVPAVSGTVGSVIFTITENAGDEDDDVTATIPHGSATEFFGRVSGVVTP